MLLACSNRRAVTGVRVHRGFQDWGSIDTYEFQLQCNHLEEEADVNQLGTAAAARTGLTTDSSSLAELLISTLGADEALHYVQSMFSREIPPTAQIDKAPLASRSVGVIDADVTGATTRTRRSASTHLQREDEL